MPWAPPVQRSTPLNFATPGSTVISGGSTWKLRISLPAGQGISW